MLSGLKIKECIKKGTIKINPFDEKNLGPNSYDVRLDNTLCIYEDEELDMKKENKVRSIIIPESGILLLPNKLYLGRTVEYTETNSYVPMIEGRSSIGRLGVNIHVTAGFGDIGFSGYWTLEISCIQPVVIYSNVKIGQLYFHEIEGDYITYNGKYNKNKGVQSSLLYKDF